MQRVVAGLVIVAGIFAASVFVLPREPTPEHFSETEIGFENDDIAENVIDVVQTALEKPSDLPLMEGRVQWSRYWQDFSAEEARYYGAWVRVPGPMRVGIQAGHWRNSEVPDELDDLRRNGGGAQGGGYSEVDTVLEIAERVKVLLEAEGIVVDLLPATVPPDYEADAFVSIHADGSTSASVSGFKISGPRRDFSGRAVTLVTALTTAYASETGLRADPNVTRRMSGYYAFNWRRYEHAVHPMTPAVIIETGFMTNTSDRALLVHSPEIPAHGIAAGILAFLASSKGH